MARGAAGVGRGGCRWPSGCCWWRCTTARTSPCGSSPRCSVSLRRPCRVIQRLGPLLAIEPARASQDAVERLWIVDGTLVPVRDRKVGVSSRNYRFSANVQVIMDAETRLVVAAARPVPGNTADAKAWRDSGLAAHCEGVTVLGDGAYINTGLIVPHRKRPGRPLLKAEEEDNAQHRKVRARVEHTFSRMKNYKILRDLGRFTQPDPSGQETNAYLYAGGDPINNSDPSGLGFLDSVSDFFETPMTSGRCHGLHRRNRGCCDDKHHRDSHHHGWPMGDRSRSRRKLRRGRRARLQQRRPHQLRIADPGRSLFSKPGVTGSWGPVSPTALL